MQVSADTTDVAIVSVNGDDAFLASLYGMVQGGPVSAHQWFADRDRDSSSDRLAALAKFYKLTPQELKIDSVQNCVMTKIAVKEYIK